MFRYRFELMGNPQFLTIHTTLRFHDGKYSIDDHEVLEIVEKISGVDNSCIGSRVTRHSLCVPVGRAFDRLQVGEEIVAMLEAWSGMKAEKYADTILPPPETEGDREYIFD